MKIKLENISHSYSNNKTALQNINLELHKGITGFIGVNGAGKSSLLNILATTITPTKGSYFLDDIDIMAHPLEARKILGYLPQNIGFLPELSIYQYINYIGLLKGCTASYLKEEIDSVLNTLNLYDRKNTKIKELSGGMKQRVGIAQAIINKPKILILDEPVIGLDPNERNNFNTIISDISRDAIIFISSHIIEDIENVCENVLLLEKGDVKYYGDTTALILSMKNLVFEKTMSRNDYSKIQNKSNIVRTKPLGENILVRFISESETEATPVPATLEDAFIFKTKI